jgi:general nucleoside transport system ATP-binding protein
MGLENNLALKMSDITKSFPGVLANDKITLEVRWGEVHGLLGENGAGKSTLMNILYGLHRPDSGEIYVDGKKVEIASPRAAVELGIGMVHQNFMLVENLTTLENVILGIPLKHPPFLDLDSARRRFEELVQEYQLPLNPSTPVWQLPVGHQQWLEILKQLFRDARILVLDEPTSVLAPAQVHQLFRFVRRLVGEGRAVIFISHKFGEVFEVTDRITVLRDGRLMGVLQTPQTNRSELARLMVGRPVSLDRRARPKLDAQEKILEIKDLSCVDERKLPALKNLFLDIKGGEIVGVAGVDGNGQRELAECIGGLREKTGGTIRIKDQLVTEVGRDPSLLGYVPEDRRKTGLALSFSVEENLILKSYAMAPYASRGILHWGTIRKKAQSLIKEYNIKTSHPSVPVRHLSGGNQQKVIIAREFHGQPALIVASQPTRGLDLSAVESVHDVLLRERDRGAAVLFISTELEEVLSLSDRIIVLFKGEIMGEVSGEQANIDQIGEMMLGHKLQEEVPA